MSETLRVLQIEDMESDAALIVRLLENSGYLVHAERVEDEKGLRESFAREDWDVVIADYHLPQLNAERALLVRNECARDVPFIVVSGNVGEDCAVEIMRGGAQDYVLKDRMARLVPAVLREIREARSRRQSLLAKEKLRAALNWSASIVESSNDAIIGCTLEGAITSWNRRAEALYGYSAAEMIGEPIERLIPSVLLPDTRLIDERLEHITGVECHETLRLASGGREVNVLLSITPILNSDGVVIGLSNVMHDISEAKAQREALRLSEEQRLLAIEAGKVGLWCLESLTKKWLWTARCKALHGLSLESPVPDFPASLALVHPADRNAVEKGIRQALEVGAELAVEYRSMDNYGAPMQWTRMVGQAQVDSSGQMTGLYGTMMDLTERREMEERLRRATRQLEQLTYATAHDLREPLRNIMLAASLLKGRESNPEVGRDLPLVSDIVQNVERIGEMLASLKTLLVCSRGLERTNAKNNTADSCLVLSKALRSLTAAIDEKQAEITYSDLPAVAMNEAYLLVIFQNLIANAVKYCQYAVNIQIGWEEKLGETVLYVKDDGAGIAPELQERAFGMFKRLQTQAEIRGAGLGLAMCRQIVEHYGGSIWIESQSGEGATFFFTVPALKGAGAAG